jgi:hypothetical protein
MELILICLLVLVIFFAQQLLGKLSAFQRFVTSLVCGCLFAIMVLTDNFRLSGPKMDLMVVAIAGVWKNYNKYRDETQVVKT